MTIWQLIASMYFAKGALAAFVVLMVVLDRHLGRSRVRPAKGIRRREAGKPR